MRNVYVGGDTLTLWMMPLTCRYTSPSNIWAANDLITSSLNLSCSFKQLVIDPPGTYSKNLPSSCEGDFIERTNNVQAQEGGCLLGSEVSDDMRMIQPTEDLPFLLQLEQQVATLGQSFSINLLDSKKFSRGRVGGEVDTSVRSLSQKFTTNPFGDHCQRKLGSIVQWIVDSTHVVDHLIARQSRDY